MTTVSITQNDDIETAVEQALGHLPIEDLITGRLVAVKPNETTATAEDKTGVTQPDTLRAVLRYLKRFNPGHLVVTGGAGAAETDEVFRIAGLMAVVQEEGAEFVDHNRAPFQSVPLDYGPDSEVTGPQREIMVNPRVLEYETLVSLAQLKLHATATVTLTMKNIAMSYPAADYYGHPRHQQHHPNAFFDDMHSFITAMVRRFPIQLGIIAGHPAMIGTGPLGGVPIETGLVIASRDPVAADAVGAQLLGFNAQAVRHLWEASRGGMGETQPSNMRFPGLSMEEATRAFTSRAYGRELVFQS
jgi:uncharacterized protein (DUF362 family)